MGIENFSSEKESKSGIEGGSEQQAIDEEYRSLGALTDAEDAIKAAKAIRVKYIEEEIGKAEGIEEKLEIIDSWPTQKEWNKYKEGITTSLSQNLSSQTSLTKNEVYMQAGAHPGQFKIWGSNSKYKILGDLYYAAFIFGDNFTVEDFKSISWLSNHSRINRTFDKTFNDIKNELDLVVNNKQRISSSEVKAEIDNSFDIEETITRDEVSDRCSFSGSLILERFGSGSFIDGLLSLGFDVTDEQVKRSEGLTPNKSTTQRVDTVLDDMGVSEDCDGYLYLLKCTDHNSKTRFYVGSIGMGKSVSKRMREHIRNGGHFKAKIYEDGRWKTLNYSEFHWDIDIEYIKCLDCKDMSEQEFNEHISGLEFSKMKECSRKLDKPVLGGT